MQYYVMPEKNEINPRMQSAKLSRIHFFSEKSNNMFSMIPYYIHNPYPYICF